MNNYNKIIKISEKDKNFSAILFDSSINRASLIKTFKNENIKYWIFDKKNLTETEIEALSFMDDKAVIKLPFSDALSLYDILSLSKIEALNYLKEIVEAIAEIKTQKNTTPIVHINTVFILKDKSIAILNSDFFKKVRDLSSESYNFETFSFLNHPYLDNPYQQNSFTIACLLYKILTGEFPFFGNSEKEVATKIKNNIIIEPDIFNPALSKKTSIFLLNFFKKKKYLNFTLEDWKEKLSIILNEEDFLKKDMNTIKEQNTNLEYLDSAIKKSEKKYKKALFLQNNLKTIIIYSSISLTLIILLSYFIYNYYKPRTTKGFTPYEVVKAYYNSFNTLNNTLIADCVMDHAATKDLQTIIALHLKRSQLISYNIEDYFISADKWIKKGKPDIISPYYLFGVSEPKITKITSSENEFLFLAEYEKYYSVPNTESKESEKQKIKSFFIKEELYLKPDRGDWVIYKINRLEEKFLN